MSAPITDRPVNVGVVGLGFMGLTHINAYRKIEGVEVVAVCDAVRQPVNGVLAGITGNVAGSDTVDLGPSVRAYSKIEDLLADGRWISSTSACRRRCTCRRRLPPCRPAST